MKIYIAGPYSKGDTVINVAEAIDAADAILSLGADPFIPHLSMFWHFKRPKPYETWLQYVRWLEVCDALFRLEGESPGADVEEAEARRLGIPVFYTLEDLKEWLEGKA